MDIGSATIAKKPKAVLSIPVSPISSRSKPEFGTYGLPMSSAQMGPNI